MSQVIELSDESAAYLQRQARERGLTVDEWVRSLAGAVEPEGES